MSMCDRKDNESKGEKGWWRKSINTLLTALNHFLNYTARTQVAVCPVPKSRDIIFITSSPFLCLLFRCCTGSGTGKTVNKQEGWRLTFSPSPWLGACDSPVVGVPVSPGEGVRETKKEEQMRKPERLTTLRVKWDGNGKRDRAIGKGGREAAAIKRGRSWGGGAEENEMRPNFLWQSPCSCCRCWGHFTKAGPDANVISSWAPGEFATVPHD